MNIFDNIFRPVRKEVSSLWFLSASILSSFKHITILYVWSEKPRTLLTPQKRTFMRPWANLIWKRSFSFFPPSYKSLYSQDGHQKGQLIQ